MALTLSQIQAITDDVWLPDSYDNWSMGNVLMWKLLQNAEKVGSGEYVRAVLEYTKGRGGAMSGATTFETAKKAFLNAARYPWAYFYSNFTYDIEDEVQISGGDAEIDFVMKGLDNAQKTIRDDMGDSLWQSYATSQSSWGSETKPFWGVENLMTSTDTSPYFGLIQKADLGTFTREGSSANIWQAYENTSALSMNFATIQLLRRNTSVSNDPGGRPDLYITTDTLWDAFENSLQAQQRHYDEAIAKAGFDGLKIGSRGTLVSDNKCPSGYVNAFNFDRLKLKAHRDKFFAGPKWKEPTNMAVKTTQIIFSGAFTCTERRGQGRCTSVS